MAVWPSTKAHPTTGSANLVRCNLIDPETNNRIKRVLKTAKKKPARRRAA